MTLGGDAVNFADGETCAFLSVSAFLFFKLLILLLPGVCASGVVHFIANCVQFSASRSFFTSLRNTNMKGRFLLFMTEGSCLRMWPYEKGDIRC